MSKISTIKRAPAALLEESGAILPNGAVVLDSRMSANGGGLYLAKTHRGEYVTWRTIPGDPDSTHTGHYFNDDLTAALGSFASR